MLQREDRLKIEVNKDLHPEDACALHLLYGPLLGKDALYVYEQLYALSAMPQAVKNHLLLQKVSGLSMELIETSRILLEQYLLLKTYYDGSKNAYLYVLYPPKSGVEFLSHDVFGRLYLQKMGKQVYEYMKRNFAPKVEEKSSYQDITVNMRNLLGNWQEQEEQVFDSLRPETEAFQTTFRFDVFLNGLSGVVFPQTLRTKENLRFIAEKAELYGIDEKEMQKLVGKSINLKTNALDQKKLVQLIQRSHEAFTKVIEDPYQLPPVRFLQSRQQGIPVSKADQNLIDHVLHETYQLKPEVINVLIEYVLERCNQVLRKSYVEKVAATWVRLGVDTKEKALQVIAQESKSGMNKQVPQTKELPKWYTDQESVTTSQEDLDEADLMEKLRKLGVNDG